MEVTWVDLLVSAADTCAMIPARIRHRSRRSSPVYLTSKSGGGATLACSRQITEVTCARDGPRCSQLRSSFTLVSSPQAKTSTRPSARLRAYPRIPSESARSRVDARYQTPCTRPETVHKQHIIAAYSMPWAGRAQTWAAAKCAYRITRKTRISQWGEPSTLPQGKSMPNYN